MQPRIDNKNDAATTGAQSLSSKRIAIAGLGEIGKTVARKLAQGMPGLALAAIATRDRRRRKPGSIAKASPVR